VFKKLEKTDLYIIINAKDGIDEYLCTKAKSIAVRKFLIIVIHHTMVEKQNKQNNLTKS